MGKQKTACAALLAVFLVCTVHGFSRVEANQWIRTYGAPGSDNLYAVEQTADGGYIAAGSIKPFGYGNDDAWVLKLDADGDISWQWAYGNEARELAFSIQQTASDGGFIFAGTADTGHPSVDDVWIVKLDATGSVVWQKAYDISKKDMPRSIQQTLDGGYIVAGFSDYNNYDQLKGFILRLDVNGNALWQKIINDVWWAYLSDVRQTTDGGFIAVGIVATLDPTGSGIWVLKLDNNGNVLWQKVYRYPEGTDYTFSLLSIEPVLSPADGGYVLTSGLRHSLIDSDALVLRIDGNGQLLWQKTYGGSEVDEVTAIRQTLDGGYIMVGQTSSFNVDWRDVWVLKLDPDGNVGWQKTYGNTGPDSGYSIRQTSDGGYIVGGVTKGPEATSFYDGLVLKLDANGSIPNCFLVGSSQAEVGELRVTMQDANIPVGNLISTAHSVSYNVVEPGSGMTAFCWRQWEGRFDVLEWLDRARMCLKWPSGIGIGAPGRCPAGNNCIFCRYQLSKYMQAEKIPEFLSNIYSEIIPLLAGRNDRADPNDTRRQLERQFGGVTAGSFYTETLKATLLREIKSSTKIGPRLLGRLVEAINAIELDLIAPLQSTARVKAGKYQAVDFDGLAGAVFSNVEKSGMASLKIRPGLPASAQGMQPAWPVASYELDFTGTLAKNGYMDINIYIGGLNVVGKTSAVRLLQWNGKSYRDITTHLDYKRGIINGRTDQPAIYVIMSSGPRYPDK